MRRWLADWFGRPEALASLNEDAVRERFGVPADRRQVGVVALGYRFESFDGEVR